jgi:hypothetical protein
MSSLSSRDEGKDAEEEEHSGKDDENDMTTRSKRDFEDEWFTLQQLFMQWREKEPEKNVLYEKAISMVQPRQTLAYYQGVYHTLCAMHPIIELVLKPGFAEDPQAAMNTILQLQTGFVIGQLLERWPTHLVPRITDKGNPRARSSTLKDK